MTKGISHAPNLLTHSGFHWALENSELFRVPSAEQSSLECSRFGSAGSVTLVPASSMKVQSARVWTRVQDLAGQRPQKETEESLLGPEITGTRGIMLLSFHPPTHYRLIF